jgi:hypothetical protein
MMNPNRLSRWLPTPGNVIFTLLVAGLLIMTQQVWGAASFTNLPGASATTVNYQGRLADRNGNTLNGPQNLEFSIYDTNTGGNLIWGSESHTGVPVSDGLFSVGLGSLTAGGIPTSTWNGDRYLQITVNGETLSPRELIRSVPIAGMALTVPDGALNSRQVKLANGQISPSNNMSLTSDYQLIPGMSVNLSPETNQTYMFYLVAELADFGSTDGYGVAQLYVDGTGTGKAALMDFDADLGTVAQVYTVNLNAGPHTIEVRAKSSQGGGELWKHHSSLSWFAVSQ